MDSMQKYEQKCTKVVIRIRKDLEPELINYLDQMQNKSKYIKTLIRNDMKLREVTK